MTVKITIIIEDGDHAVYDVQSSYPYRERPQCSNCHHIWEMHARDSSADPPRCRVDDCTCAAYAI